jgi:hypothetical protein
MNLLDKAHQNVYKDEGILPSMESLGNIVE